MTPSSPISEPLTALARYSEAEASGVLDDETPVERLRFFCSLALNGQDWLDVEPFFDAILAHPPSAETAPASPELSMSMFASRADLEETEVQLALDAIKPLCTRAGIEWAWRALSQSSTGSKKP